MKISLKWINEFVDIKDYFQKPEALAALLTNAGLEVEEIINKAQALEHVVIGLILEKDKHPDAEKLSVCKVTTGEGVVHQIVCGAKNHKAEDRVIVALPGAVLPGNFAIKKSVLRGVESGGMLCSYKELGLEDTTDGIAILPENAPLGKSYAEYVGLDDIIFELKVTPNRADCLSHLGLAREIGCLTGRNVNWPKIEIKEGALSTQKLIQLQVLDKEMCPRYTGRVIKNVKVGKSPDWLKAKLESIGQSSINNIVDVTNYVMHEMGQPLHAFDFDKIEGALVKVGRAPKDEKFVTLDGTTLTLTGEELMIQSATRSMCMAGTIGGKDSGVSDSTQNLFLESAFFAAQNVRKAARIHGLNTESSYRFSRGVDPRQSREALNRAAQLIAQVSGGEICSDPYDLIATELEPATIQITTSLIADRLGYPVDAAKFENFMLRLGCEVKKEGEKYFVKAPSWRVDIEIDMDLVEEYARLNGYEHIPETLPAFSVFPTQHDAKYLRPLKIKDLLMGQGFNEAINFGFVGSKEQKKLISNITAFRASGLQWSDEAIRLMNPLGDNLDIMRQSLFTGLLQNVNHNFHHGVENGKLFEVGQVFFKENDKFSESQRLGLAAWGEPVSLWKSSPVPLVMSLKTSLESVLAALKISSFEFVTPADVGPNFLHRGQVAYLKVEGRMVGYIGTLHPVIREELKIRCDLAFAEIDLEALLKNKERVYRVQGISKLPPVVRDMALVMPTLVKAGSLIPVIEKAGGQILQGVEIFDAFTGESLGRGQKSVTYRLMLQSQDQTLTEAMISEVLTKVKESALKLDGVQVR